MIQNFIWCVDENIWHLINEVILDYPSIDFILCLSYNKARFIETGFINYTKYERVKPVDKYKKELKVMLVAEEVPHRSQQEISEIVEF